MANKRKTELRKAGYPFPRRMTPATIRKYQEIARLKLAFVPNEKIAEKVGYKKIDRVSALDRDPAFQIIYKEVEADYLAHLDSKIVKKRARVIGKAVDLSPEALEKQAELMRDPKQIVPHSVQQKAASDLLDRAGVVIERKDVGSQEPPPPILQQQINLFVQVLKESDGQNPIIDIKGRRPARIDSPGDSPRATGKNEEKVSD